jgi:hypothetical protein
MAIGILAKPELPELLRWAFFYLFLFSIGYSVGPQFFGSLKKEAVPQILLALVVAISGLAAVIGVTAVFGFDEGIATGLLSGGMTQSAALGTGLSAIAELPIAEETKAALMANAPLADAITYGFGDRADPASRGRPEIMRVTGASESEKARRARQAAWSNPEPITVFALISSRTQVAGLPLGSWKNDMPTRGWRYSVCNAATIY